MMLVWRVAGAVPACQAGLLEMLPSRAPWGWNDVVLPADTGNHSTGSTWYLPGLVLL
jgi:hypothetical protein